jgi:protein-glutamine gamma-glutamyltransferase
VVAAVVMVAVLAVVGQGVVDAFTAAGAIVLPPLGFSFSHAQRHRSSWSTKVILAVALLAAFGAFLQSVRLAGSVDDARTSLASLFLWVQVLHAFDVPRRRDLAFSVAASVTLIAEAGALSLETSFLAYLVPWSALAGAWLFLTSRPRSDELLRAEVRRLGDGAAARRLASWRIVAAAAMAVVLASAAVFLAMPRLPGAVVLSPPFSLRHRLPVPEFEGQVVNPGLQSDGGDGVSDFSPTAYPGFGGRVDLRSRGRLSERLVMRVRAPRPALWRGEAFDVYDGVGWVASDDRTRSIPSADGAAATVPSAPSPAEATFAPTERVVQTFYLESREPNVVFGAYRPSEVYFPAGGLRIDRYDSIRAPILLDPGLIYSVVSEVPAASPQALRYLTPSWPPEVLARYTQLPDTMPSRIGELARRITAGESTIVGKVLAVQRWLRENTRYDLGIPPDPPGTDPIDQFLFVRRRGFCEHIASAMAVLLREVGVPTRLVTGFGPGERNAFTGYFEVRELDAHAWVEVLYPGAGWMAYDPTFGVPQAGGFADSFIAPEVIRALGRALSGVVPEPLTRAAGAIGSGVAGAAKAVARSWPAATGVALASLAAAVLARRRRRGGRGRPPPATGASAAFLRLERTARDRGVDRRPSQTPSEFLRALERTGLLPDERDDAALVVRTFERDRFGEHGADRQDVRASEEAAARMARRRRENATR